MTRRLNVYRERGLLILIAGMAAVLLACPAWGELTTGGGRAPELTLEPADPCFTNPDQVVIHIWMRDIGETINGGQFFLTYDNTVLDFVSANAAAAPSPYTFLVYFAANESAGTIDLATGVPAGSPGDSVDNVMAVLTFELMPAYSELCDVSGLVDWRAHEPPTRLTTDIGEPVYPATVALGGITVDAENPTATAPDPVTAACDDALPTPATNYAEFEAIGGSASDNCTAAADLAVSHSDGPLVGGICGGTVTRTYTIADGCGNSVNVDQVITVNDDVDPTATAPAGATYECAGDIPAGVTTYADFVAAGGTASDNCTAGDDLTVSFVDGALSDPCGGTLVRTYTIADECGNTVEVTQTFTIDDTTAPTATAPAGATFECAGDIPAGVTTYADFVAAGGTASDNCTAGDDLAVSFVDGALSDPCGGTLVRTYTIADECGNDVEVTQTFTIDDTTAPTATAPTAVTVACDDVLPTPATTYAEFAAAGGTASDNCTVADDLAVSHSDGPLVGGICGGTITRTYTIADACGNSVDVDQVITVNDDVDPTATAPAGATYECEGDIPAGVTTYADFVAAGGTASDNCTAGDDLTVSFVDGALSDPCGGTLVRTYTIADECGNDVEVTQTFTVDDTTDPTITAPDDISGEATEGDCTLTLTLTEIGEPTVADNCTAVGDLVVTWVRSDGAPNLDDPFPAGVTTITWTVADVCGNEASDVQTITVTGGAELAVTVELEPMLYDPNPSVPGDVIERCITFELWNCPDDPAPSKTLSSVLTFPVDDDGTPHTATATLLLDCGDYNCITARDELHSLRRTDEGFYLDGNQYIASFVGDPDAGGDWLIGGNFNDDVWVDILDYGIYTWQWNIDYGSRDTDCDTAYPHADVSGDGFVDNADFTFIQIHFLERSELNCCGVAGLALGDGPVEAISIEELEELGLGHLAVSDLNGDGWLDVDDVIAFAQGVRPYQNHGKLSNERPDSAGSLGTRR